MESKLLFAVFEFVLLAGFIMAKPEGQLQDVVGTLAKEQTTNDKESNMVMEDMNSETSIAHVVNDANANGSCHFSVSVWLKPGASARCGCLRCTCQTGGNFACAYHFAYCPYFYCVNQIYSPSKEICCRGKVYEKKAHFACCGYFYYDRRHSQCCNYYSVKPRKATCPRFKI